MDLLQGNELAMAVARQEVGSTLNRVLIDMDNSVSSSGATTHWIAHCKPKLKTIAEQVTVRGFSELTFAELRRDAEGQELYKEIIVTLSEAVRLGAKL